VVIGVFVTLVVLGSVLGSAKGGSSRNDVAVGSPAPNAVKIGPTVKLTRFVDDFNRPDGALGQPWAATPWSRGSDIVPTISGNRSIDASGTHQGAVSHLLSGPVSGPIKLRIMVPSKYNGPNNDGGVGSSDVALDYCIDLATGHGYRWQIDSDSGAYLRLWKHSAASTGYTPVAGPWPYKLVSGQGLWVEYDPATGVHRAGVVERDGSEKLIGTAVDKTYTSGYAGFGLEVAGSTSSQVDDFVLEHPLVAEAIRTKVVVTSPAGARPPRSDGRFWLGDYLRLYVRFPTLSVGLHRRYRVCWRYPAFRRGACRTALAARSWPRKPPRIRAGLNDDLRISWYVGNTLVAKRSLRITGE
jgi:hypothetical protein